MKFKTIELDAVKSSLFSIPGLIFTVLLSLYVYRRVQIAIFKRNTKSKDGISLDTQFFSIPLLRTVLTKKRKGEIVDWTHEQFEELSDTFLVKLAGVRIYFTRDPENIKAILATQFNDFALGTRHEHFLPLLGDGIFTLDGEGWKHSRAMLRPQFSREQIAHVQALEPHLQYFASHVRNAKGSTINLQDLFFKLTLDTASEFLFGESVATLQDESIGISQTNAFDGRENFAESFNLAQSYLATRSWSQFFYPLINPKEFRVACANVHKFAKYYVNKALEINPEDLDKTNPQGYVFLYELVKETRNPKVLQDQLLNILIAGRDTTAGLLSFTFFELARNPEIWAKLKEEVYSHFGRENVDDISFESLKKCEYLKFIINEALRLYPSVPLNYRTTTKDTTLPYGGGDGSEKLFVPKGTTVAYDIFSTHRMKKFYGKDSLEFKPERWAEGGRYGWAYLPFNGGPRICLGQQFALTEAAYIITRLVQLFPNLESRDDRPYPCAKNEQLTMCHYDGVFVSLYE
ncbi:cytochrome P450 52A13 [[Candida] railenensis]|uniref:Cytochrome P450 52A13 n=1 Tax=[Candida] railenensis TaxID=45579 RepID=A0A9P0VWP3_9ASCO|nr:cytochrome P450 52A13 [[Candida] railenensis]